MKTISSSIYEAFGLVVLASVALLSQVQAVVPPPDGGYPNLNTAEGQNALFNVTTGVGNAAVGWHSLFSNTDGSFNTALGAATLFSNIGDQSTGQGTLNTAIGTAALLSNTIGHENTAVGATALLNNTAGVFNTALGVFTLQSNQNALSNTAAGYRALNLNDSSGNGLGSYNSAFGAFALEHNTDGEANSAFGTGAMESNQTGQSNVAVGASALFHNLIGDGNTAIGAVALEYQTGFGNTALGAGAGSNLQAGDGNVYIGQGVVGVTNEDDHTYIRNINTTSVSGMNTDTVTVNLTTGLLGHLTSSRRHKQDIKPMANGSEVLYRLKPVTYRYKQDIDQSQTLDYGLVAEDVAEVDPNLAVRNKEGQIETVRYNAINAMLLNEFLKEHRKNEEQEATIARITSTGAKQEATIAKQQQQIEALTAGLQKVNAKLDLNKPATQVAGIRP